MRTFNAVLLAVLISLPAFAQPGNPPQGSLPTRSYGPSYPPDYFKYGPSWLGSRGSPEEFGKLFGPKRPAKLENGITSTTLSQSGNGMAVEVRLWADVPVTSKHAYALRYQLRLHTKKGEEGPVLGTAALPTGISYTLQTQAADDSWNGLEGAVDITRKELSGMIGLPEVKEGTEGVFVRVEPFVYDVTADKYNTPGRTNAVMLYATVGKDRKVEQLVPLMDWAAFTARTAPETLKPVLDDLDAYRQEECGVGMTLGRMLDDKSVKSETKRHIIAALPLAMSSDFVGRQRDVFDALTDLAKADDADLMAAAEDKIKAIREYNREKFNSKK
jgi:hypothetical protein